MVMVAQSAYRHKLNSVGAIINNMDREEMITVGYMVCDRL